MPPRSFTWMLLFLSILMCVFLMTSLNRLTMTGTWTEPIGENTQSCLSNPIRCLLRKLASADRTERGEICTFRLLQEYFRTMHQFPFEGRWEEEGCTKTSLPSYAPVFKLNDTDTSNSYKTCHAQNKTIDYTFYPDMCRFQHGTSLPPNYWGECVVRKNITNIMTMGDSNGRRYYDSLIRLVSASPFVTCEILKQEHEGKQGYSMDMVYYRIPTLNQSRIATERRGCRSCGSIQTRCTYTTPNRTTSILIEHVPLLHFKEGSYKIIDDINAENGEDMYFPEFIFRYYLVGHYPNVLFLFSPFVHEKFQRSLYKVWADMTYFFDILATHLPNSTQLIVLSSAYEQEKLKADTALIEMDRLGKYVGVLANDIITQLNHMLYKLLEPRLLSNSANYYGFFNLGSLSEGVLDAWCSDVVHMYYVWYEHVLSHVLQLTCT